MPFQETPHGSSKVLPHIILNNYVSSGVDLKAMVRITHKDTRSRTLLKGFEGGFLTLEFSSHELPLLATLSLDGFLKIFHVESSFEKFILFYVGKSSRGG